MGKRKTKRSSFERKRNEEEEANFVGNISENESESDRDRGGGGCNGNTESDSRGDGLASSNSNNEDDDNLMKSEMVESISMFFRIAPQKDLSK